MSVGASLPAICGWAPAGGAPAAGDAPPGGGGWFPGEHCVAEAATRNSSDADTISRPFFTQ